MNAQEALEIISQNLAVAIHDNDGINSEYEQKQINALELAAFALEMQIPKKPQMSESGMFYICPTCSKFINRREKSHGNIDIPHCRWCGQALDWR